MILHNPVETPNKSKGDGLESRWVDWAKDTKRNPEEKSVDAAESPKSRIPNAEKCPACGGTGFLEKQRNRYGLPKCLLCEGTGQLGVKPFKRLFPEKPKKPQHRASFQINTELVLLFALATVFFVCPMMCSNPSSQKSPDYLGAAAEKIDKGLPLNAPEKDALKNVFKSDDDKAKEIEKKNGE